MSKYDNFMSKIPQYHVQTTILVSWNFFESNHICMVLSGTSKYTMVLAWYLSKNMVIPWYTALSMALDEHIYGICKVSSGASKHGFTMVLV